MTDRVIHFESTPNPATLKFIFPETIANETFEASSPQEAERSPLIAKLFGFPWTQKVFLGSDFVSVTKADWVDWNVLAGPLKGLIEEHWNSGGEFLKADGGAQTSNEYDPSDSPLVRKIKEILIRDIRPVVALDGGDIVFSSYEDGKVFVTLKGSCSGCPSSTATLKQGVEARMKELLPEVREVIAI